MGLLNYDNLFSKLRMNSCDGGKSPHKVAMLLAIINLFEKHILVSNKIYFNQDLKLEFTHQFNLLARGNDQDSPHLPYFHLRSSGFWHHYIKPGKQESYKKLTTVSGAGVINEYIEYAYLDAELFELLGNEIVRKMLRKALYKNLDDGERLDLLDVGSGWNWLECEFVVDLYFRMLEMQINKQAFVKTHLYSELLPSLNNRNIKSVESKCQNVSAIMVQYGYPYVIGLKPRWNYQKQLDKVVLSRLTGHSNEIDDLIEKNLAIPEADEVLIEWDKVLDSVLPEHIPGVKDSKPEYLARKIDYSQRENSNRKLGESGEKFVMEYERFRMIQAGREDLVDEIEWSSKKVGDGLGYDIRSFDPFNDEEKFIEVKTTNSGKYQPFYISDNEVSFSMDYADKYSLYRVYDFKSNPRLFSIEGNVKNHVSLHPKMYQANYS